MSFTCFNQIWYGPYSSICEDVLKSIVKSREIKQHIKLSEKWMGDRLPKYHWYIM